MTQEEKGNEFRRIFTINKEYIENVPLDKKKGNYILSFISFVLGIDNDIFLSIVKEKAIDDDFTKKLVYLLSNLINIDVPPTDYTGDEMVEYLKSNIAKNNKKNKEEDIVSNVNYNEDKIKEKEAIIKELKEKIETLEDTISRLNEDLSKRAKIRYDEKYYEQKRMIEDHQNQIIKLDARCRMQQKEYEAEKEKLLDQIKYKTDECYRQEVIIERNFISQGRLDEALIRNKKKLELEKAKNEKDYTEKEQKLLDEIRAIKLSIQNINNGNSINNTYQKPKEREKVLKIDEKTKYFYELAKNTDFDEKKFKQIKRMEKIDVNKTFIENIITKPLEQIEFMLDIKEELIKIYKNTNPPIKKEKAEYVNRLEKILSILSEADYESGQIMQIKRLTTLDVTPSEIIEIINPTYSWQQIKEVIDIKAKIIRKMSQKKNLKETVKDIINK